MKGGRTVSSDVISLTVKGWHNIRVRHSGSIYKDMYVSRSESCANGTGRSSWCYLHSDRRHGEGDKGRYHKNESLVHGKS